MNVSRHVQSDMSLDAEIISASKLNWKFRKGLRGLYLVRSGGLSLLAQTSETDRRTLVFPTDPPEPLGALPHQ